MTRRIAIALLAVVAIPGRADSGAEAWDMIAAMAAALAEDNAPGFLKAIDPKMTGYAELATNVQAMIGQADLHSVITPLRNEGGDTLRTLELDWELRLTRKGEENRTSIREEGVTVQLHRDGKRWRIVKLEPLSFFAPPNFS